MHLFSKKGMRFKLPSALCRQGIIFFIRMMTSWYGNLFRFAGPLLGESIGHRWIPLTKGQVKRNFGVSSILAQANFWHNCFRTNWYDIELVATTIVLKQDDYDSMNLDILTLNAFLMDVIFFCSGGQFMKQHIFKNFHFLFYTNKHVDYIHSGRSHTENHRNWITPNTVGCYYNGVQFNIILYATLQLHWQYIYKSPPSQKTPHIQPTCATYSANIVSILDIEWTHIEIQRNAMSSDIFNNKISNHDFQSAISSSLN